MSALGDCPAREVTTREIEDLLRSIASTGVAPRTVNKARQLICAIFNYGMRPSTYGLATNPAQHADRRREPDPASLAFYSPEQIEALARALADGKHRDPRRPALGDDEIAARAREDAQDAELIRVAAYAGLRRGELVALRWRDVDFPRTARSSSAGPCRRDGGAVDQESPSTRGSSPGSSCYRSRSPQPPWRLHRAGRLRVRQPVRPPARSLSAPSPLRARSRRCRPRAIALPRPASHLRLAARRRRDRPARA